MPDNNVMPFVEDQITLELVEEMSDIAQLI